MVAPALSYAVNSACQILQKSEKVKSGFQYLQSNPIISHSDNKVLLCLKDYFFHYPPATPDEVKDSEEKFGEDSFGAYLSKARVKVLDPAFLLSAALMFGGVSTPFMICRVIVCSAAILDNGYYLAKRFSHEEMTGAKRFFLLNEMVLQATCLYAPTPLLQMAYQTSAVIKLLKIGSILTSMAFAKAAQLEAQRKLTLATQDIIHIFSLTIDIDPETKRPTDPEAYQEALDKNTSGKEKWNEALADYDKATHDLDRIWASLFSRS